MSTPLKCILTGFGYILFLAYFFNIIKKMQFIVIRQKYFRICKKESRHKAFSQTGIPIPLLTLSKILLLNWRISNKTICVQTSPFSEMGKIVWTSIVSMRELKLYHLQFYSFGITIENILCADFIFVIFGQVLFLPEILQLSSFKLIYFYLT